MKTGENSMKMSHLEISRRMLISGMAGALPARAAAKTRAIRWLLRDI